MNSSSSPSANNRPERSSSRIDSNLTRLHSLLDPPFRDSRSLQAHVNASKNTSNTSTFKSSTLLDKTKPVAHVDQHIKEPWLSPKSRKPPVRPFTSVTRFDSFTSSRYEPSPALTDIKEPSPVFKQTLSLTQTVPIQDLSGETYLHYDENRVREKGPAAITRGVTLDLS